MVGFSHVVAEKLEDGYVKYAELGVKVGPSPEPYTVTKSTVLVHRTSTIIVGFRYSRVGYNKRLVMNPPKREVIPVDGPDAGFHGS